MTDVSIAQSNLLEFNKELFLNNGVPNKIWKHEPILNYDTDLKLSKKFKWTAQPTKSLFIRFKDGSYSVVLTHRDARLNSNKVKNIIGMRPSICNENEMSAVTGCIPGAVCPFGLHSSIKLLVDNSLFTFDELMYTPGDPHYTFSFKTQYLEFILKSLSNDVIFFNMT